jgi:hypothetical protein
MHVICWYGRGNIMNVNAHLTDQILVYDPLHSTMIQHVLKRGRNRNSRPYACQHALPMAILTSSINATTAADNVPPPMILAVTIRRRNLPADLDTR